MGLYNLMWTDMGHYSFDILQINYGHRTSTLDGVWTWHIVVPMDCIVHCDHNKMQTVPQQNEKLCK